MHNVLIVQNGFNSQREAILSGGGKHTLALSEYLTAKGYSVTSILRKKSLQHFYQKQTKFVEYSKVIPYEEKLYSSEIALLFIYFARVLIVIFLLRKVKRDISIASSHLFFDILPFLFSNSEKVRVTYIHHIISEQKRNGLAFGIVGFLEQLSFWVIKRKKFLVFTDSNNVTKPLIDKYRLDKSLVITSANGIDLNYIQKVGHPSNKRSGILFCGRLVKAKGIYDLIEIFERLINQNIKTNLTIAGDGPEKKNILKVIKTKGLSSRVQIVGFVKENKKISLMKENELFVFPTHEEGWGIVIGEALACNIPVIVYGLEDLKPIWKDTVQWIKPFEINTYVEVVKDNLQHKEKYKDNVARGFAFSKSIDWQIILEKELKYIQKKISTKNK